jgi:pyruvate kinase
VARRLVVGDRIRIDFHAVCIRVIETHPTHCLAVVEAGGHVGSNKAADVDREIPLAPLTPKDEHCIALGRRLGIRDYALSFAQSQRTVRHIRELAGTDARIIAKIESRRGLRNLVPILEEADEILIDRGDLSREVAIEKVPLLQRRIIAVARSKGRPVHVATNLLESMVLTSSATRAEVNDVISTLEMGASGLVLAAETAIGRYPCEAVAMIRRLITQFERWTPHTTIADLLDDDSATATGSGDDEGSAVMLRAGDADLGSLSIAP